jgi:uncharacterized protein involved in propanediol utilization
MIAVEIQVNGQVVATCGADAVRQLVAMVAARGLAEAASSGAAAANTRLPERGIDELLKWVSARIAVGDDVMLRFVQGARARASSS